MLAFVLSCAMVWTLLPTQVFASPPVATSGSWKPTTTKTKVSYIDFCNILEGNLNKLFAKITGTTPEDGNSYGGYGSGSSVSENYVIENVIKYLANCMWADSNMLWSENGMYNALYDGVPGAYTKNMYSTIDAQLGTIKQKALDHYKSGTTNTYGQVNYDAVLPVFNDNSSLSVFRERGMITPGKGEGCYSSTIQSLLQKHVYQNVINIVASELETIPEGTMGYNDVAKLVVDHIGALASSPSDSQDTPSAVPSNGWPTGISTSSSLIIGDATVTEIASIRGFEEDTTPNATISVSTATANHPAIYAITPNSYNDIDPGDEFAYLKGNDSGFLQFDLDEIQDIYIILGHSFAVTENTNVGLGDTYIKLAAEAAFRHINDALKEHLGVSYRVTVLSAPRHSDSDPASAIINSYNQNLEKYVADFVATTPGGTPNSKWRYLEVSGGSWDELESYWTAMGTAVVNAGDTGSSTSIPIGTSATGYDITAVYNLYQRHADELRPFFDVYQNAYSYAASLWTVGFGTEKPTSPADDTEYQGYYLDMDSYAFGMSTSLIKDLYEYGYKRDPKKNQVSSGPSNTLDHDALEKVQRPLELISNAVEIGHEIQVPNGTLDDIELTNIGYAALAAGVVYDPFVSSEGNEEYIATVKHMFTDLSEEEEAKIERLLHEAYSHKKPLYVLDGSKSSWLKEESVQSAPAGDYRYARLSDVLQHDVATTRVYTVVKGGMEPSTVDASTWEYTHGDKEKDKNTESNATSATITSDEDTDNGAYIATTGSGNKVVASSTMVSSSQQMTAPVMYSSGAKNGAWTGNWDGSASGYAASLGGLTTIIIHNAAQDAKSNQYVQHPETAMLFMNGLGDIVLADGTMILPAIANPAIYHYDNIQEHVDSSSSWETFFTGVGTALIGGILVVSIPVTGGGSLAAIPGIGAIMGTTAASGAAGTALGTWFDKFGDVSAPDVVKNLYDETCAYYPYTAAFMNHYPSVIINGSGKLAVVNTNDSGKYMLGIDEAGNLLARRITGFNDKTQANLQYSGGGITIAPIQGLSFSVQDDLDKIGTALPYVEGEDGTFWSKLNTARKFKFFMVKNTIYSGKDQAFFPLNSDISDLKESYLGLSSPLTTSAKRFLTQRTSTTSQNIHHDTFNVEHYIVNMAGEGLMGTQYSNTLQKNYKISYDELVQDTGNRLLTFFVQIVESAIEHLGKIDGVLAIKNGYENKFFNLIVEFIQQFYLLIAITLLIIVAIKFMRGHYNMIFVCFIAALCVCGFEVYANWMPTVVPAAYNFAVNDAIEQIVWNTTVVSAESYNETYKDSGRKDATSGAPKPYTATMTLYKMTRADMETVAGRLGTTYKALKSGEVIYLDETAGIFVQGDSIKISVDKLLVNNSMRGLYYSQWEELGNNVTSSDEFITPITNEDDQVGNPYLIQLQNPYVSLEAYYMPFNEIERAFMINLNSFSSIFRMERNQFSYGRNLYKDAFLFNCFTNSGIFTAPGDKDVLRENIKVGSVIGRSSDPTANEDALLNRVYGGDGLDAVFAAPKDWLNISAVLRSPSENMKKSLWGRTMLDRGWYREDGTAWSITEEGVDKLADLIAYINEQTKQFVIDNSDQLNFCSDENAIKLVSLYATTCFTHYVSEFGDWLYPNYLNAADIELKDVLYGSMTTLRDRNFAADGTVVNTVAYNLGVFGVIFLLLITVFATIFVFVMTYLVPILYAMFGAILIFKLINNKEGIGLVQGYIKVTGVTCFLYFIFSLSLRLVEIGGYAWYGYLGCALVMFLCCYFLFWVCLSVVQNAGEMGNEVLGQNLLRGIDKITRGAVRKITTNTLNARRGIRGYGGRGYGYGGYGSPYEYGRGYGIDSRDYVRGSRSAFGFGRRHGYNDYNYGSYGRGYSYDEGLYEREGRRRVGNVIYGMFNRSPRGSRQAGGSEGSHSRERAASGMGRYASGGHRSSGGNVHRINDSNRGHL